MRKTVFGALAVAVAVGVVAASPGAAALGAPARTAASAERAGAAGVAGCDASTITATGDLDGDGVPEVVVGMPTYPGGGAVDVRFTAGGGTVLTAASLGAWTPSAADRFGAAVVVTELNGDRCADLVIGAPGHAGAGAVVIALGSPTGYRAADARVVSSPTHTSGASFGSSLVVLDGPLRGTGGPVVVAGMPGLPVNGRSAAGALVAVDAPGGVPGAVDIVTENTPGVPGTAEAGDRFGSVLARGSMGSELLVGVPLEDVGPVVDAGAVSVVHLDSWGRWGGSAYSENTFEMPGVAEAGDRFGASVIAGGVTPGRSAEPVVTVGVPGEDIGSVRDAGTIVSFVPQLSLVELGTVVHQGGTWRGRPVPGSNETGDAFGSALAWQRVGLDIQRLLVGVPREDIGSTVDAGRLGTFDIGPEMGGTMSSVTESAPLFHGYVEAGDRFGATLASGQYASHVGAFDHRNRVVVGIPGENVRAAVDAGAVEVTDEGERARVLTFSRGERAGLAYGTVLGAAQP